LWIIRVGRLAEHHLMIRNEISYLSITPATEGIDWSLMLGKWVFPLAQWPLTKWLSPPRTPLGISGWGISGWDFRYCFFQLGLNVWYAN